LKVSVEVHKWISSGSEFQTDGAATENARRAMSVLILGTDNRGARHVIKTRAYVASPQIARGVRVHLYYRSFRWY